MGERDQLQEVAVPRLILREQRQVVVLLRALTGVTVEPGAGCDVGLDPEDRRDALQAGVLVETQRAEHGPVVGERQGRHTELRGLGEQRRGEGAGRGWLDPGGPVEQGELRMDVEVDEALLGHRCWSLPLLMELSTSGPDGCGNLHGCDPKEPHGTPGSGGRQGCRSRRAVASTSSRSPGNASSTLTRSPVNGCSNDRRQEWRNGRARPSRRASSPTPP